MVEAFSLALHVTAAGLLCRSVAAGLLSSGAGDERWWAAVLLVFAPWCGALLTAGRRNDRDARDAVGRKAPSRTNAESRVARPLLRGGRALWPAALPFLALLHWRDATALCACSALLVAAGWKEGRQSFWYGDTATSWKHPWSLGLLGLCLGLSIAVAGRAWALRYPGDNDAAYYFGVARRIVESGRFEEQLIWHGLNPSRNIAHPPFDYWSGLTSLLMLGPMAVFGATYQVGVMSIALFFVLGLVALWGTLCLTGVVRSPVLQLVGLLLSAWSPAMAHFSVDTESVPVAATLLSFALFFFASQRPVLCAASASAMVLARSDAAILACPFVVGSVAQAWRSATGRGPMWSRVLLVAAAASLPVLWNLALHGSLAPPGSSRAIFLHSYHDIYALEPRLYTLEELLRHHENAHFWFERALVAWKNLLEIDFVPHNELWFGLIFLAGAALGGRKRALAVLLWILLFPCTALISAWGYRVFATGRTLFMMMPAVILAGLLGADQIVQRWLLPLARSPSLLNSRSTWLCAVRPLATGAAALLVLPFALSLALPPPRGEGKKVKVRVVETFAPLILGRPVAVVKPWWTYAFSDSPVVLVPSDGETAISRVLEAHGVEYLVLDAPCRWKSQNVCKAISAGKKRRVGRFKLEPLRNMKGGKLYRVLSERTLSERESQPLKNDELSPTSPARPDQSAEVDEPIEGAQQSEATLLRSGFVQAK